jgi:hypothetical protein
VSQQASEKGLGKTSVDMGARKTSLDLARNSSSLGRNSNTGVRHSDSIGPHRP